MDAFEGASLDEAYVDLSSLGGFDEAEAHARALTWRSGDVAARIAPALGLVHVHARERVFPPRVHGRLIMGARGFVEGPAILSRFPSVVHRGLRLAAR